MVSSEEIIKQLSGMGLRFRFFGRREVRELSSIINQGEMIRHCVYGTYEGGTGLLVATDRRILLIDKRPFFLNIEDFRYEMLNDVYFAGRLLSASVSLHTGSKELRFTSPADARLRHLYAFTQDQISRARRLDHMAENDAQKHLFSAGWRPFTMLVGRPRVTKFSGRLAASRLLQD